MTDDLIRGILETGIVDAYKLGVQSAKKFPTVTILRWICPVCDGDGTWSDGRCMHCAGNGLTNDVAGWDESELKPAPRPPALMTRPCADCAYRPGSPEQESGSVKLPTDEPFYCHHAMPLIRGTYVPTATIGELPLGAMLCAGWWAQATGQPAPDKPYREPADRPETDRP
jgi:hypothetical protein